MAAASVTMESRSRPSTMKMVLEAMQDEDGKSGVSVQEIKRRILAKYPEKQETRLRTSLKKVFEKALADGTIVRVKNQTGAGSALTGSFRIANKKPPAKTKGPAKKPPTKEAESAAGTKGKAIAPKIKVTKAEKKTDAEKPAAKKKPTAKAPVKKTVSGASTASTSSTASSASVASASSAASFSSSVSLESSPRAASRREAVSRTPPCSPTELRPVAPRQKKVQEAPPPTGKENVPPGSKTAGKKKRAPAAAAAVEAAGATEKPAPKKTKAKAGPASKVAGK